MNSAGLPYVPFKIVFVEGSYLYTTDGDGGVSHLEMMPAAIAVGDYDCLFSTQRIVSTHPEYNSMQVACACDGDGCQLAPLWLLLLASSWRLWLQVWRS